MWFKIDKSIKVAIYGCGQRSCNIYQYFRNIGYTVSYFVDKQPSSYIGKFDCPVIKLDDIKDNEHLDVVFVIGLQNGILHDDIALELYNKGIEKILFLPTSISYNYAENMREYYCKILENEWNENNEIPFFSDMIKKLDNFNIIEDYDKKVICWVSMEYIFSLYDKGNILYKNYFEKHISCLKPYIELFEYIQGKAKYPGDYLTMNRGNDVEQQKKLLEDRVRLFNIYEEKINKDAAYFCSAAPIALWDAKKEVFKILDGYHRAIYLFLKGWYEVPIRISKDDYYQYEKCVKLQQWNEMKREKKQALCRICVELQKWIELNNVKFKYISESDETKNYISSWMQKNDVYTDELNSQEISSLLIMIKKHRKHLDSLTEKSVSMIISDDSIEEFMKLSKRVCLFSGYIDNEHMTINLYEV